MLVLVPLVVGVAAGLAAGGRLGNWADVQIRWPWLVVAALVVREAVALSPLNQFDELRYVYALFLAVLIGWTVWHFRRLPGVWLVSVGATLNVIVVMANGARMPVVSHAHGGSLVQLGHLGQYVLMDSSTRLNWLGDWILVPAGLGGAYSPGDVVIGLGTGLVAFLVTRRHAPASKLDETSAGIGS